MEHIKIFKIWIISADFTETTHFSNLRFWPWVAWVDPNWGGKSFQAWRHVLGAMSVALCLGSPVKNPGIWSLSRYFSGEHWHLKDFGTIWRSIFQRKWNPSDPKVGQPTVALCPDGNTVVQPLEWTSGHPELPVGLLNCWIVVENHPKVIQFSQNFIQNILQSIRQLLWHPWHRTFQAALSCYPGPPAANVQIPHPFQRAIWSVSLGKLENSNSSSRFGQKLDENHDWYAKNWMNIMKIHDESWWLSAWRSSICVAFLWVPLWPRFLETFGGPKKVGIAHLASSAMSLNWDQVLITKRLTKIWGLRGDPKNQSINPSLCHLIFLQFSFRSAYVWVTSLPVFSPQQVTTYRPWGHGAMGPWGHGAMPLFRLWRVATPLAPVFLRPNSGAVPKCTAVCPSQLGRKVRWSWGDPWYSWHHGWWIFGRMGDVDDVDR